MGVTSLLLLFFFFFVFLVKVIPITSSNVKAQGCSSSCGPISNITYPFRLTTDPPNCGDSDYELTCRENNTLIATINSTSYFVKWISYPSRTLRLLDTQLSLSSCEIPRNSPSLGDLTSDPRYRGRVSDTDTTFFSCSKGTNLSSETYRRVPCLDKGENKGYVAYAVYILSSLGGSCKCISRVPTTYQPVLHPSYGSIADLVQSGFDVSWSLDCRDCVKNGRACILKSPETPSAFKCHKGDAISTAIKDVVFHAGFCIWSALFISKREFFLL